MKRLKSWQKNLIFAAVVLAAAALLFVLYRANAPKAEPLVAVVDFGDGITETIPLDEDHDYLYDVGDYIVHLQVKDGAIAFLDSHFSLNGNSGGFIKVVGSILIGRSDPYLL